MKIRMLLFQIGCMLLILLLNFILSTGISQDTISTSDTNRLIILFAGDIMGHDGQISAAYDSVTGSYNYEPTFRYIKNYISDADIAIANLEVTLAGPPYKGYPQFSSPDNLAVEAKNAGFDILATANNHALDGGRKGFVRTLRVLDSLGFMHLGTYRDSAERAADYPLIFEKHHIHIALLNYTYGTNGLKIPLPYLINRIDTAQISMDLKKAHKADPDFIVVFVHWGIEYERNENADQKKLAAFLFRNGADVVIGSHPHVVQPIDYIELPGDTIHRYPVVYSLGNFVSNQRTQYRDGGIVAELHLATTNGRATMDSLYYLPYWVWKKKDPSGKSYFFVLPVSEYELNPQAFNLSDSDKSHLLQFSGDTREHVGQAKESGYYLKRKSCDEPTAPDIYKQ
jgi:hypothetical protein